MHTIAAEGQGIQRARGHTYTFGLERTLFFFFFFFSFSLSSSSASSSVKARVECAVAAENPASDAKRCEVGDDDRCRSSELRTAAPEVTEEEAGAALLVSSSSSNPPPPPLPANMPDRLEVMDPADFDRRCAPPPPLEAAADASAAVSSALLFALFLLVLDGDPPRNSITAFSAGRSAGGISPYP